MSQNHVTEGEITCKLGVKNAWYFQVKRIPVGHSIDKDWEVVEERDRARSESSCGFWILSTVEVVEECLWCKKESDLCSVKTTPAAVTLVRITVTSFWVTVLFLEQNRGKKRWIINKLSEDVRDAAKAFCLKSG